MILAIDVGNSNIKFGVYAKGGIYGEGSWTKRFRIQTVLSKTPDEYGLLFKPLLENAGIDLSLIRSACVSCVVPPLSSVMSEMVGSLIGRQPILVGPGTKTGIKIRTDNPAEVGSDIVVNAVAARARFGEACVVIAFGSALTFSAVTDTGELPGVAIAPGLSSAAESLSKTTAQLRLFEFGMPKTVMGKNTTESLQAGFLFGYAGLVEAIVGRFIRELGTDARIIATGDQARHVMPITSLQADYDPWLTLEGLRLIAEKNS